MSVIKLLLMDILFFSLSLVFHGFVFAQLWTWFVAERFHVAEISTAGGAGITLIVAFSHAMVTDHAKAIKERGEHEHENENALINFVYRAALCLVVLFIGSVVHSCI